MNRHGFKDRRFKVFFNLESLEFTDDSAFCGLDIPVSSGIGEILALFFEISLELGKLPVAVSAVFLKQAGIEAKHVALISDDPGVLKVELIIIFLEADRRPHGSIGFVDGKAPKAARLTHRLVSDCDPRRKCISFGHLEPSLHWLRR